MRLAGVGLYDSTCFASGKAFTWFFRRNGGDLTIQGVIESHIVGLKQAAFLVRRRNTLK
jgi:hypothetical protein